MTRQDAEKLAIKLGLSTWDMGDDGFGGEDVPNKKAVELLMQYDLAAASPQAPPLEQIFAGRFDENWTPEQENELLAKMVARRGASPGLERIAQEIAEQFVLSKQSYLREKDVEHWKPIILAILSR